MEQHVCICTPTIGRAWIIQQLRDEQFSLWGLHTREPRLLDRLLLSVIFLVLAVVLTMISHILELHLGLVVFRRGLDLPLHITPAALKTNGGGGIIVT